MATAADLITPESTTQKTNVTQASEAEKVVEYVAEDLMNKIKLSSSTKGSVASSGSIPSSPPDSVSSSCWSSSAGLASPDHAPIVDAQVLSDLEVQARGVADNFHLTMSHIQGLLQKMSSLTLQNLHVQSSAVDATCDSVDTAIKNMYTVVARCEEIGKYMEPVYTLQSQIREIKRVLDIFEHQLASEK